MLGGCGSGGGPCHPHDLDRARRTPPTGAAPTTTITTATTVADTPATTTPPVRSYDFSAVAPIVEKFINGNDLNGAGLVVVERDDGVIDEEYWGDFDAHRVSLIASSSKMITAGVLLRLQDDGLLDINAPVAEVVDWGSAHPEITPAELLSNSSGLVGLLPDPAYAPYLCQYVAVGSLRACAETIFTTPDDEGDVVAPDTQFRYGGAQWQVAGAVAEVASGKTWAELVDRTYVQPCGVDSLGYNNHFTQLKPSGFDYPADFNANPTKLSATDNPNMEGGAYITADDYARLLLMQLRGGTCGDTQVLSQSALDIMHNDRIAEAYDGNAGGPDTGYGMGWWIHRDTGYVSDNGAYGTVPWLDLADGYGAYLVIEANGNLGAQLSGLLQDLIDTAVAEGRNPE